MNNQLKDPSIGIGQIRILKFIEHHEGCCQRDINDHFMMDKGTTTSLIKNLEKNELIVRVKSPADSRQNLLSLSEKGATLSTEITSLLKGWTQLLLNGFSDAEREIAFQVLNRMVDNLSDLGEKEK